MNKVELLGRLTKDPEIRYTQNSNTLVASFNLAVNRRFVKEGEERQVDFISIVAFTKTAEFIEKYFKKGMQIALVGRIQTRTWEDDNSKKHYITEVIAEEVYFAESTNKQTVDSSILNGPAPTSTPSPSSVQPAGIDNEEICCDDDLPF